MKFRSKYTHEDYEITAAQYLAEFMSERKAKKDGKALPVKFWNVRGFKSTFFQQLKLANTLLKEYDIRVILNVLREMKYVYSLANKKLIQKIKQLHEQYEKNKSVVQLEEAFQEEVTIEPKDENTVILDLKHLAPKKKSTRGLLE